MNDKVDKEVKRVKVRLVAEHTHAGVDHKVDDVIEVREDQAKRLIENQRGVAV